MAPITSVRDISRIAYGFMASKALFAALSLDLFSMLANGPATLDELVEKTRVTPNRLRTLLAALVGLGLIERPSDGRYANAPASQTYLVRGAPADFGDYFRYQVDRIIYPGLVHLDAGLAGRPTGLSHLYDRDPSLADDFTRAQHAGSAGPAAVLADAVDLTGYRSLLDVGGGSGAFTIALCRRYPDLRATIIDLPNVAAVGAEFVRRAKLESRITFVAGNALEVSWAAAPDVILMSYLLSAVAGPDISALIDRAWQTLRPGGVLLIHDFMLDDDDMGPALAACWFLAYLAYATDNESFSARDITERLVRRGFVETEAKPLIPGITKLVTGHKPH